MGNQEEDFVKTKTKGLLERYGLIIENLTFEYIAQSTDQKELERILKVLRSGEEGCYPELTRSCEERIGDLFPESRVLVTPQVVLACLEKEEKEEIKVYTSGIRKMDHLLVKNAEVAPMIPACVPVRKVATVKSTKIPVADISVGVKKEPAPVVKSVVPRSYAEWDKFDPEVEMLKMDLDAERQIEKKERKNKMSKNTRRKIGKYKQEDEIVTLDSKDILTPCEQVTLAYSEKLKGNECYRDKDYEDAFKHYSKSIMLQPTVDNYNNRAAAYLHMEKLTLCVADCSEALKLDPWNVKALFRRGTASKRLNSIESAIQDFQQIMDIDPNNFPAANSLSKLQFEKLEQQHAKGDAPMICKPTNSHRVLIQELD